MKLRYSPVCAARNTKIEVISELHIRLDDIDYEFDRDLDDVSWPNVRDDTDNAILEAYRDETGTLCLTIVRRYGPGESLEWDDGQYHEVTA